MQLVESSKKIGEQNHTGSPHLWYIHSEFLTWNITGSTFSYNNNKRFFSKTDHVQVRSADQTTNLKGKDL